MKRLQTFISGIAALLRRLWNRSRKRTQQPVALHTLSILQEEKKNQIVFQSHYVNESNSSSAFAAAEHFKQSQQLTVSVSSGLRPPPAGIVKIIDLCKNAN